MSYKIFKKNAGNIPPEMNKKIKKIQKDIFKNRGSMLVLFDEEEENKITRRVTVKRFVLQQVMKRESIKG